MVDKLDDVVDVSPLDRLKEVEVCSVLGLSTAVINHRQEKVL